jgi:ketosteroid isomerase-like protein
VVSLVELTGVIGGATANRLCRAIAEGTALRQYNAISDQEGFMVEAQEIAMSAAHRKKFAEALKQQDFAALGNLYANDAVILPPGANIIMGKGNIQSYWENMSGQIQDVEFETVNVAVIGSDAIREIGRFRMTRKPGPVALDEEQGSPQERAAKYVFVWQKVNGDWKVVASMWNRIGGPNRNQNGRPAEGPGGRRGAGPGGRARGFGG